MGRCLAADCNWLHSQADCDCHEGVASSVAFGKTVANIETKQLQDAIGIYKQLLSSLSFLPSNGFVMNVLNDLLHAAEQLLSIKQTIDKTEASLDLDISMLVKEVKDLALEILRLAKESELYKEVAAALSGTGWVSSSVAKLTDKMTEILEKVPSGISEAAQLADDILPAVAEAFAAVTIVPDIYDDMNYPCGCCTVPDSALIPWNSAEQPSPESHRAALESEQLEAYMAQQKQLSRLTVVTDNLQKHVCKFEGFREGVFQ